MIFKESHRSRYILAVVVLICAIALAYGDSIGNTFLHWDDDIYVWRNPYLGHFDATTIWWALTTFYTGNWHPLTLLSHALDVALFGLNPVPMRIETLVLHAINAIALLFLAIRLIDRWTVQHDRSRPTLTFAAAVICALIFAVHPLRVESVVWIAERKDVLYALFYLLAIHSWLTWTVRRTKRWYLATVGLFFLSCAAKPMAVTLPALLLVLDFFPLRRDQESRWYKLLVEKLPLFAISLLFAVLTLFAQKYWGAFLSSNQVGAIPRLLNADHSLILYITETIWPGTLLPHYVYPEYVMHFGVHAALELFVLISAAAAAAGLWYRGIRAPGAALMAYLVMLSPVLEIIQAGYQSSADRFTYLTTVPLYLAVIAAAIYAIPRIPRKLTITAAVIFMTWFGWVLQHTVKQTLIWRDDYTLWAYIVRHSPRDAIAQSNLGSSLLAQHQYAEALSHLRSALAIRPDYTAATANAGYALSMLGRFAEAAQEYQAVSKRHPKDIGVRMHLGIAQFNAHQYLDASHSFEAVLAMAPDNPNAHTYLAYALYMLGEYDKARIELNAVLAARPDERSAQRLDQLLRNQATKRPADSGSR